jgi:hypothetical protein
MNINGMFTGRALKITADTLLDQFRKTFGADKKPGDFNFMVEFQLTSQSDVGSPEQAEQQLNALLGIARCLNDAQTYQVSIGLNVVSQQEEALKTETQRLVEAQLAVAAPEKKLVLPTR